jgi:hypothetical protein
MNAFTASIHSMLYRESTKVIRNTIKAAAITDGSP